MVNINMDYSFDCTQFVVVSGAKHPAREDNVCSALAEIWGEAVLTGDNIQAEKSKYVSLHSKTHVKLFEFEDKEFLGEFEGWSDIEQVPERVIKFEDCILKLIEYGYDVEKVFIIQIPSEKAERVYETKTKPLSKALYCMSLFYTGEGAGCETLVVSFC